MAVFKIMFFFCVNFTITRLHDLKEKWNIYDSVTVLKLILEKLKSIIYDILYFKCEKIKF